MATQLTDNSDIRNALAGIYRHFQTLDKAHLFDAVIAEEASPRPAQQAGSSAQQAVRPAQENQALKRYVTKIPCNASDISGTPMNVAVQTDTIYDNKTYERLKTAEEDSVKLKTEFTEFKKEMRERLESLEKLVHDLQERTSSINSSSAGTISTSSQNDFSNSRSDNSSGSNTSATLMASESNNNNSNGYSSIHNGASTGRLSSFTEHIYEDPVVFDPDSLPRYRAPPPPGSAPSSTAGANTDPSRPQNTALVQQGQSLQGSTHQGNHQRGVLASSTPATPLSLGVSPSQPLSQLHSGASSSAGPRALPRSASMPAAGTAPSPPASSPPPRPFEIPNSQLEQMNSSAANSSSSSANSRQAEAGQERSRTAGVLRSASNPSPSHPPAVRPRVKPRLTSVGAPGLEKIVQSSELSGSSEGDPEQHEAGTVAIRGIKTRPGLDINTGESDTLVIELISPFLSSRSPILADGKPNPEHTRGPTRHDTGVAGGSSVAVNTPVTNFQSGFGLDSGTSASVPSATSTNQGVPLTGARPLGIAARPTTVYPIHFAIESMTRFKAAAKKLHLQHLALELECCLRLQTKEKMLVNLVPTVLSGSAKTPQKSSASQQASSSSSSSSSSLSASAASAAASPLPSSSSSPVRAYVSVILTGRDVSDDKILDQGWVLNLYQSCHVVFNPKELFKAKGKIMLLVEIKLDDLGYSQC
ncbi:hypothetical protein PoB_007234900 [Plakobranchus ocellatus]|uniref:Uncharacterized protein n=1 Tax=Plakobranchus ocellatus TaxID=259542 RepID=A0AAV4DNV7_9GAST|nr:hypothetical protein PoB_007234900 [Plakobranchus ocellatus]